MHQKPLKKIETSEYVLVEMNKLQVKEKHSFIGKLQMMNRVQNRNRGQAVDTERHVRSLNLAEL